MRVLCACANTATLTLASTGVETKLDPDKRLDKGNIITGHYKKEDHCQRIGLQEQEKLPEDAPTLPLCSAIH